MCQLAKVLHYMECLECNFENWNVWILKTENWHLKFVCEMFGIWKFEN